MFVGIREQLLIGLEGLHTQEVKKSRRLIAT